MKSSEQQRCHTKAKEGADTMTTNEVIHVQQQENAWENVRKQKQIGEWIRQRKASRREKELALEKQFVEQRNMINRNEK